MTASHTSHEHLTAQMTRISPVSPQMWMSAVNNHVDKGRISVRNAVYVRLSPSVDHLWTAPHRSRHSSAADCGETSYVCARPRPARRRSPVVHHGPGRACTSSPQATIPGLRRQPTLLHSFPNTYDDYYLRNLITIHIDCAEPVVDNSRTLSTLTYRGGPS